MNIRTALADRRLPRIELRMLLGHVLQREYAWLIAHDLEALDDATAAEFESLVARRVAGEPIAYLLGEREFYGRNFRCTPAALIPRPETELLVDVALTRIAPNESIRILDVGTGTGCIAITLALERPHAAVTAIDISPDALALARDNAQRLGATNIDFIESNWFAAVSDSAQFDLIVSNPPYIVPGDAHLTQGDLRFEPAVALADAVDGVESYRQLLRGAVKHLLSDGWLVVEHGYDQGESVPALFRAAGFTQVDMLRDLADMPRVTLGKWR
ncbi:MAG TPA: peptide chain release factor N(5)-glutamine methyltransferase [Casimicrobium sp.]|nr:peptide chain release factor N(5)-glutamine methyltransferase [Casimicrobium sp.]